MKRVVGRLSVNLSYDTATNTVHATGFVNRHQDQCADHRRVLTGSEGTTAYTRNSIRGFRFYGEYTSKKIWIRLEGRWSGNHYQDFYTE